MEQNNSLVKDKKVLVLFLIASHRQFLDELPKILRHGNADGVILTNLFGSEILTNGPFPNLLHLASLAKRRFSEKQVGVEIYDSKDIASTVYAINWAKSEGFDHLWCKDGNSIVDKISEDSIIVYGADNIDMPALENIKRIKESLLSQQTLVVCGGITLENVEQFIPYSDTLVIHSAATLGKEDPYTYNHVKINEFCKKVKNHSAPDLTSNTSSNSN